MSRIDIGFIGGRGISSNYGGVENATREVTLELSKKPLNIIVYGVATEEQKELPTNLNSVDCPAWIYRTLGQHGLIFWSVLHAIFISRPKVVYLFASGPCVFTPLLRIGCLKVVTSLRAIDSARDKWGKLNTKILQFGEYCAWRFANSFTVNSREMTEHYSKNRADVVFIPNGAKTISNTRASLPNKLKGKEFFLFAARFDPVKRLHLLLEANARLDVANAPVLVIAGGNSKDLEYENELRAYESESVIFLGHISQLELEPLMLNCKAFILPSILEGMSNSLLSAMVNGKAVLAADIFANSDVIKYSDALFEADNVLALTKGLEKLATEDDFCVQLGEFLRQRAIDNYSWKATAEQFYSEGKDFLQ